MVAIQVLKAQLKHECDPYKGSLPRGLNKYRKYITDYWITEDGYTVYLIPGWKREGGDDVHFLLEDSIQDLQARFCFIEPCYCFECTQFQKEYRLIKERRRTLFQKRSK